MQLFKYETHSKEIYSNEGSETEWRRSVFHNIHLPGLQQHFYAFLLRVTNSHLSDIVIKILGDQ